MITIINRAVRTGLCAALCLQLAGCITPGGQWGSGVQMPSAQSLGSAARQAAVDPQTWVPLLTAGLLVAADVDEQWSEDLADEQALFGGDAEDTSDTLRDIATGAYVVTALLAPSDSVSDKVRGLALGAGTMLVDGVVNQGLKDLTQRDRPDGSNDESFPSGHASKAASRSALAMTNLSQIDMPDWLRTTSVWGLHGVAVGTGLARVEARKHHLSDVLAGYAMGNFVAGFMQRAFAAQEVPLAVRFSQVKDGGALTFSLPLR